MYISSKKVWNIDYYKQYDQIGPYLKALGNRFAYKSSLKRLLANFENDQLM